MVATEVVRSPKIQRGFDELNTAVMTALRRHRTPEVASELMNLLLPVWTYYINYHLGQQRVYASTEGYGDLFQEAYLYCITVLSRVKVDDKTDFGRIKTYFCKSIEGWVFNKLYKKLKKDVEITRDELRVLLHPDDDNQYKVVDLTLDVQRLEKHANTEFEHYLELCGSLLGISAYSQKKIYYDRFRKEVFAQYQRFGKLVAAHEFFARKYGVLAG